MASFECGMKRPFSAATVEKGTDVKTDDLEISSCNNHLQDPKKSKLADITSNLCLHSQEAENRSDELNFDANSEIQSPKSQFAGVHWNRRLKKWRVRIKVQGQDIHIGHYDDERAAARALEQAIMHYDGHRGNPNQPSDAPNLVAPENLASYLSTGSGINMILAAVESDAISSKERDVVPVATAHPGCHVPGLFISPF